MLICILYQTYFLGFFEIPSNQEDTFFLICSNIMNEFILPHHDVPLVKDQEEVVESTESPAVSLVPRFTKAVSEEDENYMPDLCMTNYDTLQVIHGKIFVFEEEVSGICVFSGWCGYLAVYLVGFLIRIIDKRYLVCGDNW